MNNQKFGKKFLTFFLCTLTMVFVFENQLKLHIQPFFIFLSLNFKKMFSKSGKRDSLRKRTSDAVSPRSTKYDKDKEDNAYIPLCAKIVIVVSIIFGVFGFYQTFFQTADTMIYRNKIQSLRNEMQKAIKEYNNIKQQFDDNQDLLTFCFVI